VGRGPLGRGYDERIFLCPVFRYLGGGLGANVGRTYKLALQVVPVLDQYSYRRYLSGKTENHYIT